MDFESLDEAFSDEPMLAKWECDAKLWGQFKGIEPFNARVRSARYLMILPIIMSVVVALLLMAAATTRYVSWSTSLKASVIVVALAGIFVLSGLILWSSSRPLAGAMKTKTGEVIIRLDGFTINGQQFDWRFGRKGLKYGRGARFQNGERITIGTPPGSFEVIKLTCAATTLSNRGFETDNFIHHTLPVPADRIVDADAALERLNLRARSET